MKVRNIQDVPYKVQKDGIFFIIPNDGRAYDIPDNFESECHGLLQILQPPKLIKIEPPKQILDGVKVDMNVVKIDDKHLPIFNKQRQKYSGKKYIYYLTGPDGVKYNDIDDIKQFCIDHGLVRNNIMTMAQKEKKYMGWTGYRKTIECKRETNRGAEQRDNERKAKILEDQKNMKETLIEDILK